MKCKMCGLKYHYCTNCGYDIDTHPQYKGYCGWICLIDSWSNEDNYNLLGAHNVVRELKRRVEDLTT